MNQWVTVFALLGLAPFCGAEAIPIENAKKQFSAWDNAILNGLLYSPVWADDSESFTYDWKLSDGKIVRRKIACLTGDIQEIPRESSASLVANKAGASDQKSVRLESTPIRASHQGWDSPNRTWKLRLEAGALLAEHSTANGKLPKLGSNEAAGETWQGEPSWSPDGKFFAIFRRQETKSRELKLYDSRNQKDVSVTYPVAGDALPEARAWVFSLETGEGYPVPKEILGALFSSERLDWTPDSTRLRTRYIQRGFNGYGVLEFNVQTRTWRKLLAEEDSKFVFAYGLNFQHDLDADTTLWSSERTGWSHLYRVDLKSGKTINALTSGPWIMKRVLRVDPVAGYVLFEALGRVTEENPYHVHICRVNFDGTGLTDLTPSNAHHEALLSPDGKFFLCTASRADLPPTYTLIRVIDGKTVATLGTANVSRAIQLGWEPRKVFHTKDREGKFAIWGIIHRPTPFDPTKRYPVLERIYAGPHDSFALPGFQPWWNPSIREPNLNGFYVVQIDGRGTYNRGKQFQQYAWKNLRDAGLPDRIAWIKAAAEKEPQMDLDRVGIYGGSAGGQNTVWALLDHGNFYKAGAADSGCYDNQLDKLWWNEQWLGYPVSRAYDYNRCATAASQLSRPLLMVVGEVDTNVDPRTSFELRDAFYAVGKKDLVDFHSVPGGGHCAGETEPLRPLLINFFLQHLGRPQPR